MQHPIDIHTVNEIKNVLLRTKESIAVAESVTCGLLQLGLGAADDAIQFFQGGITAYNLGQKSRHLLIEPIHATSCNCVSQQVANEMALHVCKLFNSNWGIATTGYASAVPEADNKIFCYYAIAHNHKIVTKKKLIPNAHQPFDIQAEYVNKLLIAFLRYLKSE